MTQILRTIADARAALEPARAAGKLALVPTMGALHDGHLSLVEIAKERAETVVVSIFVNPMQFAPGEDFERYPRTFDEDVAKLEAAGVDYVFAPAVHEMYPRGLKQTRVVGGPAAAILEGQHRLSHFDGVLTVVAKLFTITRPHLAVFGEKDAQQLHLIRRMSIDLDMGIEVIGAPIIREPDGLARSSRNIYLGPEERQAALALSRALRAVSDNGDLGLNQMLALGQGAIMDEPLVKLDYLSIVDPDTFQLVNEAYRGPAVALIAARVGTTRLIDNMATYIGGPNS